MPPASSKNMLPVIPIIIQDHLSALDMVKKQLSKFENIHAIAKKNYGIRALQIGDAFSRHWLARNQNPFLAEIDAVQKIAPHHGAYMLNLSYEWSCTSGAGPDPERPGNRMLRTLDWPMIGLGKNLVVIKRTGAAGPYWDITWPGFVGVITSMAPERFSGAINQPPMRKWSSFPRLDWILNKQKLWRQQTLPPSHLLRKTFDECQNFNEAKEMLTQTPISTPAFFTLSGVNPNECCIIERSENSGYVYNGSNVCTNHWLSSESQFWSRSLESYERRTAMKDSLHNKGFDFSWLNSPILNETTRLSMVANAAQSMMLVQGWEPEGAATQPLYISGLTP